MANNFSINSFKNQYHEVCSSHRRLFLLFIGQSVRFSQIIQLDNYALLFIACFYIYRCAGSNLFCCIVMHIRSILQQYSRGLGVFVVGCGQCVDRYYKLLIVHNMIHFASYVKIQYNTIHYYRIVLFIMKYYIGWKHVQKYQLCFVMQCK